MRANVASLVGACGAYIPWEPDEGSIDLQHPQEAIDLCARNGAAAGLRTNTDTIDSIDEAWGC